MDPHLMKTVRNNLNNSGAGKNTRYMWKDGKHLLWKHVCVISNSDGAQTLSYHHVHLTSVMSIRLAVLVLSERVGKVMLE